MSEVAVKHALVAARIIGFSFAVALICLPFQGQNAAALPAEVTQDAPFMFTSTLCSDAVLFTGTMHLKEKFGVSTRGGLLISIESNIRNAKAVSLVDGTPYVLTYAETDTARSDADLFPFTHTHQLHMTASRRGETNPLTGEQLLDDDFYLRLLLHVTFNANGDLTAMQTEGDFLDPQPVCR